MADSYVAIAPAPVTPQAILPQVGSDPGRGRTEEGAAVTTGTFGSASFLPAYPIQPVFSDSACLRSLTLTNIPCPDRAVQTETQQNLEGTKPVVSTLRLLGYGDIPRLLQHEGTRMNFTIDFSDTPSVGGFVGSQQSADHALVDPPPYHSLFKFPV